VKDRDSSRNEGKRDAEAARSGWYGLDASDLHEHGHRDWHGRKVESPGQHTLHLDRPLGEHARTAGADVDKRSADRPAPAFRIPARCEETLDSAREWKARFPPSFHCF
jgi:hypothetical protein